MVLESEAETSRSEVVAVVVVAFGEMSLEMTGEKGEEERKEEKEREEEMR